MYKIEEKTGKIQQSRIASINDLLSECQVQGAKIAPLSNKIQQLEALKMLEKKLAELMQMIKTAKFVAEHGEDHEHMTSC